MSTSLTSILFLIVLNNLMEYLISVILNIVSIQFPLGLFSSTSSRIIGFNYRIFTVLFLLFTKHNDKKVIPRITRRKETIWKELNF